MQKPSLLKESRVVILNIFVVNEVHKITKDTIEQNSAIRFRQDFDLVHFYLTVQHVNHYATGIPYGPQHFIIWGLWLEIVHAVV